MARPRLAEPSPQSTEAFDYLPWVAESFAVPRSYFQAWLAARGGGKTHAMMQHAAREIAQFGPLAKVLYLRFDHQGASDFVGKCLLHFPLAFGPRGFSYNSQRGLFTFASGGTIEVNQLSSIADFAKFQGREVSLLCVDEAQHWASPEPVDLMRSNLRGPGELQPRMILSANSGGVGHSWLLRRYYRKAPPWEPFVADDGREWVWIPSSFTDNRFVDAVDYERTLTEACAHDTALLRGWRDNDWFAVLAGTYFADCFDARRNVIEAWPSIPTHYGERWETFLAHDYGSTAPSVTYLMAKSPGAEAFGQFFPRDSLIAIDELSTNRPGDLSTGMGYTISVQAELIRELCERWEVRPEGVADDSIFARTGSDAGSIAEQFRRAGVYFYPARKASRIAGWTKLKQMLSDAGSDAPGMYVSILCTYALETLPTLPRDPKRPEDLLSAGTCDHGADSLRYSLGYAKRVARVEPMWSRR